MAQALETSNQRITELERLLQQQSAELLAARAALESLSYSVSHDLRAPLRHIIGYSKIVMEDFGEGLDVECRQHLEHIQESAQRMTGMLADMLKLSRVVQQKMSCQSVDLNTLVRVVKQEMERDIAGREVEWKIATLPQIECDPSMMKQVFCNLVSNALKFTRGRPDACVEIGSTGEDGQRTFFVRDNGAGFDMKCADRLFGVFQRFHQQKDFEGNGAGLAMVQRIVQKHGGRIWAEAAINQGATFYFTIGESAPQAGTEE